MDFISHGLWGSITFGRKSRWSFGLAFAIGMAPDLFSFGVLYIAAAFGFSPKLTMSIAQHLYEGIEFGKEGPTGLITYMRTDSTRVSEEALKSVRAYVKKTYGDKYLPEKPNQYGRAKSAQDAHEAIRPTYMDFEPEKVKKHLSAQQFKLYTLIWNRFVASQMTNAEYDVETVDI